MSKGEVDWGQFGKNQVTMLPLAKLDIWITLYEGWEELGEELFGTSCLLSEISCSQIYVVVSWLYLWYNLSHINLSFIANVFFSADFYFLYKHTPPNPHPKETFL